MSDTPLTDAEAMPWFGDTGAVSSRFARTLERRLSFVQDNYDTVIEQLHKIQKELDWYRNTYARNPDHGRDTTY
jgi:hypothetical protein